MAISGGVVLEGALNLSSDYWMTILPNVEVQWLALHSEDLPICTPQTRYTDLCHGRFRVGTSRLRAFSSTSFPVYYSLFLSNYIWCESVTVSSNKSNFKISPHLFSPALYLCLSYCCDWRGSHSGVVGVVEYSLHVRYDGASLEIGSRRFEGTGMPLYSFYDFFPLSFSLLPAFHRIHFIFLLVRTVMHSEFEIDF